MRSMPRRLGLSLLLLSVIAAASGMARAEEEGSRTGFSGLPVPRFVELKKDKVNGRAGPSLDLDVVVIYRRKGLPVKVIAETSDNAWRRIEDHTGRRVWINRAMLSENRHAVIREGGVLFSEPTDSSLPRARLEPGAIARLETCDRDWCRIRTRDFRGWTERDNLWGTPL